MRATHRCLLRMKVSRGLRDLLAHGRPACYLLITILRLVCRALPFAIRLNRQYFYIILFLILFDTTQFLRLVNTDWRVEFARVLVDFILVDWDGVVLLRLLKLVFTMLSWNFADCIVQLFLLWILQFIISIFTVSSLFLSLCGTNAIDFFALPHVQCLLYILFHLFRHILPLHFGILYCERRPGRFTCAEDLKRVIVLGKPCVDRRRRYWMRAYRKVALGEFDTSVLVWLLQVSVKFLRVYWISHRVRYVIAEVLHKVKVTLILFISQGARWHLAPDLPVILDGWYLGASHLRLRDLCCHFGFFRRLNWLCSATYLLILNNFRVLCFNMKLVAQSILSGPSFLYFHSRWVHLLLVV